MANLKLVEVYSVLLILCTSLIVFGLFQMQASVSSAMGYVNISYTQTILQGVQISAIGLVATTVIMVLFFRRLKKKLQGLSS